MENTKELLIENYKLKKELESIKIENDSLNKTITSLENEISELEYDLSQCYTKSEVTEMAKNNSLSLKEQHELEQATLLVDNLLEQLARTEKEVLTLSHDKKQLQLLNERMNNCITLQSQEIFKLLK